MKPVVQNEKHLDAATRAFYSYAIDLLTRSEIPFLVGGAYAFARYTGIIRHTKDFDVFIQRADCERILALFSQNGYRAEKTFPHWLAKVYHDDSFIDLIFSSGNGLVEVDAVWFQNAVEESVLDRTVFLCPAEEMIWSKAFIMERERYDGADIIHLLRACGTRLNWSRLLERFGPHWRLLLSHLILFGYVYPAHQAIIPTSVFSELLTRLQQDQHSASSTEPVCHGTTLSRSEYLIDIEEWGFQDARLPPQGKMSPEAIAHWTASIGIDNPSLEK
jgi:hypothetical protein